MITTTAKKKFAVIASRNLTIYQTLVFQIKFCGKSPALQVAANHYR